MTLKDCLYQTLHRSKKPLKQIAEDIGVSESYLYRAALPDQEESDTGTGCRFPLKYLVALIRSTGDFSTLDHIENSLGRVAITLPRSAANLTDICRLTLQSVQEFGELMSEVKESLDDNLITSDELARIFKEGYHVQQSVAALIAALEKKAEEKK